MAIRKCQERFREFPYFKECGGLEPAGAFNETLPVVNMVDIKRLTLNQAVIGVLLISIEIGVSTAIIVHQWKSAIARSNTSHYF
jgi:hypothetical protein